MRSRVEVGDMREPMEKATAQFSSTCWVHDTVREKVDLIWHKHRITVLAVIGVACEREGAAKEKAQRHSDSKVTVLQTKDGLSAQR